MCDEAVDDFLPSLNFIRDWFVTNKMIKKLSTALYTDVNILYFDEDSGNVLFNVDEMVFVIQILIIKKAFKKQLNEELMSVAWHPNRWWNFCVPEDKKKEIKLIFTE